MEAGRPSKRFTVGAIVQARMQSTRLPGKVLLPLPLGGAKPLLKWVTDSLKRSRYCDYIFIATSENPENDAIEAFGIEEGVEVFRGSEEDVLSRFQCLVAKHQLDLVIRLTGDNPLLDIALMDKTIEHHLQAKNTYTKTAGLPLGMNFELIEGSALTAIGDKATADEKEHVTLHTRRNEKLQKGDFRPTTEDCGKLRLTVDYPVDFVLMSQLLQLLKDTEEPGLDFVQRIQNEYPWLFDINRSVVQKQQFATDDQEITAAVGLLEGLDYKRAAKRLRSVDR